VVGEVGMLRVAVPDPPDTSVTVEGETNGEMPADETVTDRLTVPAKLSMLKRERPTDAEVPRATGIDVGFAAMEKSCAGVTVKERVAE
jgi:hypothetical protein